MPQVGKVWVAHMQLSLFCFKYHPNSLSSILHTWHFYLKDHLVGLVVKASAWGVGNRGFESCWRWDFSRSSHTSDLKTGTPVTTLPGTWCHRVSAGTGWPGVSIL